MEMYKGGASSPYRESEEYDSAAGKGEKGEEVAHYSDSPSSYAPRKGKRKHRVCDGPDDEALPESYSKSTTEDDSESNSGDSDPEYTPEKEGATGPVQPRKKSPTKSKIAPFLPENKLWQWYGKSFTRTKGRSRREFFKSIVRGEEMIEVGDCAVFFSTGQTAPYVGRIEHMWEVGGKMVVKVTWFYHPHETRGLDCMLIEPKGGLFKSPHTDENDVQTISHKCDVVPYSEYRFKLKELEEKYNDGENHELFYLAGSYNPTTGHIIMEPGVS
ncbi:protein winged eye-like [Panulirus ornatus]|uniref:protein winged eye-like n=1 Tax=Panulirus ornatus TaxID=150431 RepID=UPI003A850EFB